MAEGEKKNVIVTEVAEESRKFTGSKGEREAWTVKTENAGTIQVVQEPGVPAPKVGENLLLTVYPANGNFPPAGYPVKPGGGGGRRPSSPEERQSIERQVAFKGAVDLVVAGKAELKQIRALTDSGFAAIKGEGSGV